MHLWPLLFITVLFAQENSVERYCYSSPAEMKASFLRARPVFVPADQVTEDESCLVVQMRPHRRELIQTYLRGINPNVSISFSSAEIKRDPCRIKVEKIKNLDAQKTSGEINRNSGVIEATTTKSASVDTLQIVTLNDFELMVNFESIKGVCRYITPTKYEISLEVRKDLRPLSPPGTIVILRSNELPPPQQTSLVKTSLQLNQGDRIEIGSLIQDLKGSKAEINGDPAASGSIDSGANRERVFLSLDSP
jgi:hypothetical protein